MWQEFKNKYSINDEIIKIIEEDFKFDKITKVQNIVIPEFLKNKDVIVKSCTGSGKTLSYVIPLFQRLLSLMKLNEEEGQQNTTKDKILTVVLLPSRELCIQVFNIIIKFAEILKFTYALFIGGKKLQIDLDKLNINIPNIIVATPGRLFDLHENVKFDFKHVELLILDEADKMLEMGYEVKLTSLIANLPKQRRTGLFSATMNSQIDNIVKAGMRNPIFIDIKVVINSANADINEIFVTNIKENTDNNVKNIENSYFKIIENFDKNKDEISQLSQEVPIQLKQYYIMAERINEKFPKFYKLIFDYINGHNNKEPVKKLMIFFATCNSVDYFSIILSKLLPQTKIFKLHSKIAQKKRKLEYRNFIKCETGILLTTDLSARGIDVPDINVIIQFDPPKNEEAYIHRIGRTARAGKVGEVSIFKY